MRVSGAAGRGGGAISCHSEIAGRGDGAQVRCTAAQKAPAPAENRRPAACAPNGAVRRQACCVTIINLCRPQKKTPAKPGSRHGETNLQRGTATATDWEEGVRAMRQLTRRISVCVAADTYNIPNLSPMLIFHSGNFACHIIRVVDRTLVSAVRRAASTAA